MQLRRRWPCEADRVARAEILTLRDTFREVIVSDGLPYWHFLCRS